MGQNLVKNKLEKHIKLLIIENKRMTRDFLLSYRQQLTSHAVVGCVKVLSVLSGCFTKPCLILMIVLF